MGGSQGGFSDFFSAIFGDMMGSQMGGRQSSRGGFSGFSDFSQMYNQQNQRTRQTQNESKKEESLDIIQNVTLNIKDLIDCPKKTVTISAFQQCSVCHGSKQGFCSNCSGMGIEKITKNITFQVPKATKAGQKIRLKGEGKKDAYGKVGDVYLIVQIKDNDYEIDGANLIKDVELLPFEAVLGCEKQIETPDGKIKIKIPKETTTGKKLRLKGLGLTKKDNTKGDLEIRIKITLPNNLSKEAIKLYEQLKNINS